LILYDKIIKITNKISTIASKITKNGWVTVAGHEKITKNCLQNLKKESQKTKKMTKQTL
jgi:hypothetical protein